MQVVDGDDHRPGAGERLDPGAERPPHRLGRLVALDIPCHVRVEPDTQQAAQRRENLVEPGTEQRP